MVYYVLFTLDIIWQIIYPSFEHYQGCCRLMRSIRPAKTNFFKTILHTPFIQHWVHFNNVFALTLMYSYSWNVMSLESDDETFFRTILDIGWILSLGCVKLVFVFNHSCFPKFCSRSVTSLDIYFTWSEKWAQTRLNGDTGTIHGFWINVHLGIGMVSSNRTIIGKEIH